MTSAQPALGNSYARAMETVRERDRDRYIADLFAPTSARPHLFALHAFNAEVARIRDAVSDPALGEIRLQWWRDAIENGSGGGNPIAEALNDTIGRFNLQRGAFLRLIDARVLDLYDDPMPTVNDLEGYAGETTSSLFQLAAMVLAGGSDPGSAEAAGHAGVAYALTGWMRTLPRNIARGQTFLPQDLMAAEGIDPTAPAADVAKLKRVLAKLRAIARRHLADAEVAIRALPEAVKPGFLALALVRPYLDRMDAANYDPLAGVELAPWQRQWILWRAARRM